MRPSHIDERPTRNQPPRHADLTTDRPATSHHTTTSHLTSQRAHAHAHRPTDRQTGYKICPPHPLARLCVCVCVCVPQKQESVWGGDHSVNGGDVRRIHSIYRFITHRAAYVHTHV
mmetsp:Transcript_23244/g.66614  ORF Transcript_23244/g.66614 Transcript_23244/m.66614 type:complete len:116 (-) Transcript_23244:127-474(-)